MEREPSWHPSLPVAQTLRGAALEDCTLCQETLSSSELAAKTRDGDLEGAWRALACLDASSLSRPKPGGQGPLPPTSLEVCRVDGTSEHPCGQACQRDAPPLGVVLPSAWPTAAAVPGVEGMTVLYKLLPTLESPGSGRGGSP